MAIYSSILTWEIPWTEEPGGLQSMESQRVRHNLVTKQQKRHSEKKNTLFHLSYPFFYICRNIKRKTYIRCKGENSMNWIIVGQE